MTKVIRWTGSGDYDVSVVGESYYQANLKPIAGDVKRKKAIARLICEKNNPHDANAVKVEINGASVGHLSRDLAPVHRSKLQELKQPGAIVECEAVVVTGQDGSIGVYLDLPFDEDDEDALEDVAAPIVKKASPLRLILIMLGLLVVTLVCAAAQNVAVGVVCLAIAVWLLWKWRRIGGRFA